MSGNEIKIKTENQSKTPISSPKLQSVITLQPSTPSPPPVQNVKLKYDDINTPEMDHAAVFPYSPSLKRDSSGMIKIPETPSTNLNNFNNVQSPYSLLQTPNKKSPTNKNKFSSPQFLSPKRKELNKSQEELQEISSNLKTRLSYAFIKLQKGWTNESIDNLEKNLSKSPIKKNNNTNLKKYETFWENKLDNKDKEDTSPLKKPKSANMLLTSPKFEQAPKPQIISINDEEENSAHNALIAALSRQNNSNSRIHSRNHSRNSSLDIPNYKKKNNEFVKLPPINLTNKLNQSQSQSQNNTEQEAIISLMSLSSPRSNKFSKSIEDFKKVNSPKLNNYENKNEDDLQKGDTTSTDDETDIDNQDETDLEIESPTRRP